MYLGGGITDTCYVLAYTRMPVPFLTAWGQYINHVAFGSRYQENQRNQLQQQEKSVLPPIAESREVVGLNWVSRISEPSCSVLAG